MKFALVLCMAMLWSTNIEAHCHHHHHQHHQHHQHHPHHHHPGHRPYTIAQVFAPQETVAVVRPRIHHEYFRSHHGTHHLRDNIGATIQTSYSGTAFEPNNEGREQCLGTYSGNNVFVQPAGSHYSQFALKCKAILQSLLDFISKPVEFGCAPGSALNLDLQTRIVNHKLPCETVCLTEDAVVPVVGEKVVEVPVPIPAPSCAPEVYPVEVCPHVTECTPCATQAVQVVPVEVAPVCEPVHQVHLEPAIIPTRHVVYEQPIVNAEIIPEECEESPKEAKHQIHELHKQLHHMIHNQKKHQHHHHHHHH